MDSPRAGSRQAGVTGLEAAYIGLALLVLVAGLIGATVLLVANRVGRVLATKQVNEERTLARLAENLVASIRETQTIPGATNWVSPVASYAAMDPTEVQQVYPGFPTDTDTRRVFLIDPGLGATALPYAQGPGGLSGALTNLASASGRLLLISSSRRGLALPVSSGVATNASAFNAIWNWVYVPATRAPPAGWPASWNGMGVDLHVARINLANLFHLVNLKNVSYGVGVDPPLLSLGPTSLRLLDTTLLRVYRTNGQMYQVRRLTADLDIDLTTTNRAPPLVYFEFEERSGAVATNKGTYGSSWNGIYTNGVVLGVKAPVPPSFPSFSTNNHSASFDGVKSYVETNQKLTNILRSFSIAAWIRPAAVAKVATYIVGVRGALSLNLYSKGTKNYLQISTKNGGATSAVYPYSLGGWHHVLAIGDGASLTLYVDGAQVKRALRTSLNYYYDSNYTFRVGTGPDATGSAWSSKSATQYEGGIDQVVFYDRILATNEVQSLARGIVP